MQVKHVPAIDVRYWTAIALASIFGTNMGDLYAHDSGLGLLGGLPVLAVLFALVYAAERFDKARHDAWYWACIIILRTGATNIADWLAGRHGLHIDRWLISAVLGAVIVALALWAAKAHAVANGPGARKIVPDTDARYWVTMLTAGVFGTALGDAFQHAIGQGVAALVLSVVLAAAFLLYSRGIMAAVAAYWLTVAVARTTGTAIGDWLAENEIIKIGLPLSTLLSGVAFVLVLLLMRSRKTAQTAAA